MRGRLKEAATAPRGGGVDIDPRAMGALIEESQDLHHDAMAATAPPLDEMVETGTEARAHGASTPTSLADVAGPALPADDRCRLRRRPPRRRRHRRRPRGAVRLAGLRRLGHRCPDPPDGLVHRGAGRGHLQDGADPPVHRRVVGQPGGQGLRHHHHAAARAAPGGLQRRHHRARGQGPDQSGPGPAQGGGRRRCPGSPSPGRWWRWPSSWSRGRPRPTWPTSPPSPIPTPRRSRRRSWASRPSTPRCCWRSRRC